MIVRIGLSALLKRRRSFRQDAHSLVERLQPPLQVFGREHIPVDRDYILTINHYSRPGFDAWWLALAVSSVVEKDIHWMMTGEWTFSGHWYAGLLRPLSRWLFARLSRVYGFTTTPPIPPEERTAQARAEAVRQIIDVARQNTPKPVIGLSPEGRDFSGGVLGRPPYGSGRFIYQLNKIGYAILPVGVYEEDGRFCVRFGSAYGLGNPHSHTSGEVHPTTLRLVTQRQIDLLLTRTIMRRIAVLLPECLRGEFN